MRSETGRAFLWTAVLVGASAFALLSSTDQAVFGASPQVESPGIRLAAFRAEPSSPEFGRPFDLELRLRLAAGLALVLPDTLIPAENTASAGRAKWVERVAPADSVEILAVYPVVGLLNGEVVLPELEVWVGPSTTGETVVLSAREMAEEGGRVPPDPIFQRVLIPIGLIQITPLRELSAAGDSVALRPPADVLGRRWSTWLMLAVALFLAVSGGVAWGIVARVQARRTAGLLQASRGSPRQHALRELERIREQDLHRQGRLPEFYGASTGVLRSFAEQREADWGNALTSSELLDRIRERWGPSSAQGIVSAVPAAEMVKFGYYRPDPEVAEEHWAAIHAWIERMPDD